MGRGGIQSVYINILVDPPPPPFLFPPPPGLYVFFFRFSGQLVNVSLNIAHDFSSNKTRRVSSQIRYLFTLMWMIPVFYVFFREKR